MDSLSISDPSQPTAADESDEFSLAMPDYEFEPLDFDADEQRFLILHPCSEDKTHPDNPVRCSLVKQSLSDAEPFIAVKNSRGYRYLEEPIEVDGRQLFVVAAVGTFLRHFRHHSQPLRLWIRHVCLLEPDDRERTTYWTRDFVDTMYAVASEVVDMDQFLADKAGAGELDEVCYEEEGPREKLWNEFDRDLASPKSFPCRLGFRPLRDQPMDHYPYVPLDIVVGEIRVLVIAPAKDSTSPLITGLAHCLPQSTFYHALSYTWGRDEPTSTIIMNGQLVKVRNNLEQTLRAVRSTEGDTVVWIDALCIDQSNLAERNRQIPRISEVYHFASIVISYVGEAGDDSDLALDFIPAMQSPMIRRDQNGKWDFSKSIDPAAIPAHCVALCRFTSRPYFQRVWVLQEVAMASCATVMCGKRADVTFQQLYRASCNLAIILDGDPEVAREVYASYHQDTDFFTKCTVNITKLAYFRLLTSRGLGAESSSLFWETQEYQAMWKDDHPAYLETLIWTRDFQASVAHDKVFALWNLAADKTGLDYRMDYADSVGRSHMAFAKAWSTQHSSLDIIAAAERSDNSAGFYKDAASWCPDWSVPSATSCLVRQETIPNLLWVGDLYGKLYMADGGARIANGRLFRFQDDVLHATGVIVDRIDTVFDDLRDVPLRPEQRSQFQYVYWGIEIWRCHRARKLSTYQDPWQAYEAMVHGDVPSTWPSVSEHPDLATQAQHGERYVCRVETSRHGKHYLGGYNRGSADDVMRTVLRGRVPFVTEFGYMGLAPYWIRDDTIGTRWQLAILAGCSVPVLLQENEDGSYTFGGACFVQGWMEGEFLAREFGAADPNEFWTAVGECDNDLRLG